MGVRLALGTTPGRLRSSLLWQGLFTVIAGTIPGIAGAMASGRFLESLINGAKSIDLTTSFASVLFIILIASTSIWAATRRIAGLDIMEVLRSE
jgi:ABC-type antimicrobial peptide transport system permease subunit